MKNSLFISQNVPNTQVKRFNVSQAANNFCLHINELEFFSHHVAVPPANVDGTFQNKIEEETGIEYHLCRPFKHKGLLKTINVIFDNIWLYFRILTAKEKNIWFYNVWTGNILSYLLAYVFTSKNIYILLADYNPIRYKKWMGKLLLWAIRKAKGVISLSSRCNEVNENLLFIPGIIPESKIKKDIGSSPKNKSFLLSGTLNKNTGLDLALDVFREIPEATLFISGIINDDKKEEIEWICSKYKNIIYKGFFEKYSDYLCLLNDVDYTLSLRDPLSPVNYYNFPSKILETLAYNKIVISTIDYPELLGVNYLVAPYDKENFTIYIKNLINVDKESNFIKACLNNTDILIEKYSENTWRKAFLYMEDK